MEVRFEFAYLDGSWNALNEDDLLLGTLRYSVFYGKWIYSAAGMATSSAVLRQIADKMDEFGYAP